ncbi:MAG: protein kinase, partial [Myxococcales bacterium]|nr:protein kinase [Myxococcales bacterium]
VTSSGEIKLTDFGIARMVDGRTTGRIYGKLNYMPREQFQGDPVPASDLFALGAVFYELIAGQRFRSGCTSEEEHREAILAGMMPALDLALPPEIETALRELLDVDLEHRAQSAKAVLNVVGSWSGARNMGLALEELYLDCVDSRHSWYTAVTAQAQPEPACAAEEPRLEAPPKPERPT